MVSALWKRKYNFCRISRGSLPPLAAGTSLQSLLQALAPSGRCPPGPARSLRVGAAAVERPVRLRPSALN